MRLRPVAGALLALIAAACARGRGEPQALPAAQPGQGPGPAVGSIMPAFEARDHTGKTWTLETLRGPKGLVLNINRSVVW